MHIKESGVKAILGTYKMEIVGQTCLFPESWAMTKTMGLRLIKISDIGEDLYLIIPSNQGDAIKNAFQGMKVEEIGDVIITDNNMLLLPDGVYGPFVRLSGNMDRIEVFFQEDDNKEFEEIAALQDIITMSSK